MATPPPSTPPNLIDRLGRTGLLWVGVGACLLLTTLVAGASLLRRPAPDGAPAALGPMVAYILDTSPRMNQPAEGSTSETRLAAARAVLAEVIRPTDPSLVSGLRVFGSGASAEACTDTHLAVPFAAANQAKIVAELNGLTAGPIEGAALAEAILAAIRDLAQRDGPHLLVVITGGADSCRPEAQLLIAQEAERLGIELKTLVIGFQVPPAEAAMVKSMVDQMPGGELMLAKDKESLKTTVQSVETHIADVMAEAAAVAAVSTRTTATPSPSATVTPEGVLPVTGCTPPQVLDPSTNECRAPETSGEATAAVGSTGGPEASGTPPPVASQAATGSATTTALATRTLTTSPTATPLPPTATSSRTSTPLPTFTRTATPFVPPTRTPTPLPTNTPVPPPTNTPVPPPPPTNTPVPPPPPTNTPVPPPTSTPVTPTSTPLPTLTPTDTSVPPTLTFTPTRTPTPSATRTPTSTSGIPPTDTDTPEPPPPDTDTPTPRPTRTPTDTPEPPTDTPVPPTDTPVPTDTPEPTETPCRPIRICNPIP